MCNLTFVTAVTHTDNGYPLHVRLPELEMDDGTVLTGFAAVEQTKALDLIGRCAEKIGTVPDEIMAEISEKLMACMLREDSVLLPSW